MDRGTWPLYHDSSPVGVAEVLTVKTYTSHRDIGDLTKWRSTATYTILLY